MRKSLIDTDILSEIRKGKNYKINAESITYRAIWQQHTTSISVTLIPRFTSSRARAAPTMIICATPYLLAIFSGEYQSCFLAISISFPSYIHIGVTPCESWKPSFS